MKIESITIDGIDYDLVDVGCSFSCVECDFWNREEAGCKLEKEEFGWVCPASIVGRRIVFKKRNLNRCPRCGREAVLGKHLKSSRDMEGVCFVRWRCQCLSCSLHASSCETRAEAAAKWNKMTNNFSSSGE